MAKSLNIIRTDSSFNGNGTTSYYVFGNGGNAASQTIESRRTQTIRTDGTLSNLYIKVKTNAHSVTSTLRNRKNGANGSMAVSIAGLATGHFKDITNSDSYSAGNTICYALTNGSGSSGALVVAYISSIYDTSSGTYTKFAWVNTSSTFSTASVTRYERICNSISSSPFGSSSESGLQTAIQAAGTWSDLQVYISSNTRTTTTIRSRKNATNGNQILSITASTTGTFEDTTHSDSISAGDLLNYSLTSGTGSNSITINAITSEFKTSGNTSPIVDGEVFNNNIVGTYYKYFGGVTPATTPTESDAQIEISTAMTLTKLAIQIISNTQGSGHSFILKVNGSSGNNSISIPANTTGSFVDNSNSDNVNTGDLLNMAYTIPGTSGGVFMFCNPSILGKVVIPSVIFNGNFFQFLT